MSRRILSALFFLLFLAAPALAGDKTRWVHVRVVDGDSEGETVKINVPVNLVDGVLTLLEARAEKDGHGSHFQINDEEIDREEVRRVLSQLRDLPEGTEIGIEKDDDEAYFSRSGDRLKIRAKEDEDESFVRIELPLKMAEAFAASDDVDLSEAFQTLDEGEILVFDDEDRTTVRIWIDHQSESN
jgi:hypothetical protein